MLFLGLLGLLWGGGIGAWAQPHMPTQGCGWVSQLGDGSRETPPEPWGGEGAVGHAQDTGPAGPVDRAPLPQCLSSACVPPPCLSTEGCARDDCSDSSGFGLRPADNAPGPATLPLGLPAPPSPDCEAAVAPAMGCALPLSLSIHPSLKPAPGPPP